jgi:type VI secretion system protein ImpE
MTPQDAFAEGRLAEAVALQKAAVADRPDDPAARLFLVELLAFAGRLNDAAVHLRRIDSDDPDWPASAGSFHRLLQAERRRSFVGRLPVVLPGPVPRHAKYRWKAIRALRGGELREPNPDEAIRWVDLADAVTPEVGGFLDGQRFDGLRDADDRFASVLEAVVGGDYVWFPWEAVARVKLSAANYALDRLLRPAEVRLKDGTEYPAHLPLIYSWSHGADGVFAVGLETDRVCPDGGPVRCVGGKLLLVGDEADEQQLAECRMIEIR